MACGPAALRAIRPPPPGKHWSGRSLRDGGRLFRPAFEAQPARAVGVGDFSPRLRGHRGGRQRREPKIYMRSRAAGNKLFCGGTCSSSTVVQLLVLRRVVDVESEQETAGPPVAPRKGRGNDLLQSEQNGDVLYIRIDKRPAFCFL